VLNLTSCDITKAKSSLIITAAYSIDLTFR